MTRVIYPGSFDPLTKGHMNIIEQSANLFDEVIIAVLKNESKKENFFTIEERINMIKKIYKDNKKIKVITGLATIDLALENNCNAIIRGLRSITDFDYEIGLKEINYKLSNKKINTICLFADNKYNYISSSIVKELFRLNKNIEEYVSPIIKKRMEEKIK